MDWYNAERLQLGLDGCTPMKYRDKALKTLAG
ncbi:IS3 family transposase [Corynebacterium striatum]